MFGFGKNKLLTGLCSHIVERLEDGVVAIDSHHNIILFNEGSQRIFGYTQDDVMDQHINMLLPERFHLQHDLMIEEFGASGKDTKTIAQRTRQLYGRRKDGSEFAASLSIMKVGGGGF